MYRPTKEDPTKVCKMLLDRPVSWGSSLDFLECGCCNLTRQTPQDVPVLRHEDFPYNSSFSGLQGSSHFR
jgi:hypothetical protein